LATVVAVPDLPIGLAEPQHLRGLQSRHIIFLILSLDFHI